MWRPVISQPGIIIGCIDIGQNGIRVALHIVNRPGMTIDERAECDIGRQRKQFGPEAVRQVDRMASAHAVARDYDGFGPAAARLHNSADDRRRNMRL